MSEPTVKCSTCDHEFTRRTLRCPNCREIGVRYLYKYTQFNDHSLSILRDHQLWFPSVGSLNDPFEFAFYLTEMNIGGIPINRASLNAAIDDMKRFGVLSLTEINDDILMWSHYSKSHTGFCIQFERTDSNEFGTGDKCIPVVYSEELPAFKPLEMEDKKTVTKVMTTKSSHWSYEREWRMLTQKGNQLYPLPGPVTGVIFGCEMNQDNRRTIAGIVGDTIKYSEAKKSKDTFAVQIVPVPFTALQNAA